MMMFNICFLSVAIGLKKGVLSSCDNRLGRLVMTQNQSVIAEQILMLQPVFERMVKDSITIGILSMIVIAASSPLLI